MGRRPVRESEAFSGYRDATAASEKTPPGRGNGKNRKRGNASQAGAQNLPAARGAAGRLAGSRHPGPEEDCWRAAKQTSPVDAATSAAVQVKGKHGGGGTTTVEVSPKNMYSNMHSGMAAWCEKRQAGSRPTKVEEVKPAPKSMYADIHSGMAALISQRKRSSAGQRPAKVKEEREDSPEEEVVLASSKRKKESKGRMMRAPPADGQPSTTSASPDGDAGGGAGAGGATSSRHSYYGGGGLKDPLIHSLGDGSSAFVAGARCADDGNVPAGASSGSGAGGCGGGSADAGAGVGTGHPSDGGCSHRGSHSSRSSSYSKRPVSAFADVANAAAEEEGSGCDGSSGRGEGKGQCQDAASLPEDQVERATRGEGAECSSVWTFGDEAEDGGKDGATAKDNAKEGSKDGSKNGAKSGAKDSAKDGAKEGASTKKEKGKGKGKKGPKNLTMMSRALSIILRHRAEKLGVRIRPDGFCPLSIILNLEPMRELKVTREDIAAVVRDNDKKRFEIEEIDGETMIRAVQGHSMKAVQDEELLERLQVGSVPETCVHGTYRRFLESILDKGLVAGGSGEGHGGKWHRGYGRNHIHFVPYDEWNSGNRQIISGMRGDCDVAIIVDLPMAIEAGIPFYKSKNEVILSPGVKGVLGRRYFVEAKCTRTGAVLWSREQPVLGDMTA